MQIRTTYWPKPGPSRACDWSAIDADTYEPGDPVGYGATEDDAVADLLSQLEATL
jgi:hypothetical protein